MRTTTTPQRAWAFFCLSFLFLNTFTVAKTHAQSSVISGKVFWDCNNNDVRDAIDAGIQNITVKLLAVGSQQSPVSTITDSLGNYSFNNVSAGSYQVVVSFPNGATQLSFSTRVIGGDPTLNSDVDATGSTDVLVVVIGTNYTSIDAGIVDKTAPKIQFSNPLIQGLFSGDTLTVSCDNLPRMDSTWVTVNDNSKQTIAAIFLDNILVEGNCASNGFLKLLYCTWTATDACGNIGQNSIFVKVIDDKAPVLSNIPSNITVNTYLGDVVPTAPNNISSADNCSGLNLGIQYTQSSVISPCGSTITRTWVSSDVCGNTATQSQLIRVFDNQNCLTPIPTDTIKFQLSVSRHTDTCINSIFGNNRKVIRVAHLTDKNPQNLITLLDTASGCLKLSALQSFNQPDTLIGRTTDLIGTNFRGFFLIVTPQSLKINSCGLINNDTVARIKVASCSDKGYFCFDGVKDAIIFKNTYTISDNGAPYTGTLTGCEYDTLYSYTYFTVPKFANAGPYRLDYWLLNGSSKKIAAFRDIFALVDSMNVWDPIGKWAVDTLTLTISGGKSVNSYGQMKITRINDGSVGYLEMNSQLNSKGASVCFYSGTHEVIFKNNFMDCQDILRVVVTCDTSIVPKRPHAINDNVTVKKNDIVIFDPVANDSLFAAPLRTLTIINPPINGNYAYSGNTGVLYSPNTNFCGKDTFKYVICNNYFLCDTAYVFVTVTCQADSTPTNKKPVALNDNFTTPKNITIRIKPTVNDTINGILSSLNVSIAPKNGSIGFVGLDSLIYKPNQDFCGKDSFKYTICNNSSLCADAYVFVTVTCDTVVTPKKPIAVIDNATTKKNTLVSIDVLSNDTQNGTLTSTTIIKAPRGGTAVLNNNKIDYSPQQDSCGYIDTLQYRICNAIGCDSAKVYISVTCSTDSTPTNKKPVAVNDNFTTPKNITIRFKPTVNDTINGILSSLSESIAPKNGSIGFVGLDSLIYKPNQDFCGKDSFKYSICNNSSLCADAFVFVTVTCDTVVTPKNPIAVVDNATTKKNTLVSIDVLANDTQNGTLTSITIIKAPRRGTTILNNNKIDYSPQRDSCGYIDTLQYRICNATGCDSANVYISVTCSTDSTPTNKKPVALNDNFTTPKNITIRFKPTVNDTINGILSSLSESIAPKNGSIGFVGLDSLIYKPNQDFCGKDSFKYTICNNSSLCADAFVFVTVTCDTVVTPKKPIAVLDNATTKKNTLVSIDVLANDTQNGTLIVTNISKNPRRGTAVFNGTKIDYIPQKDSCGYIDTLRYKICNSVGCDSAFVYVTVTCTSDSTPKKPVAVTDNYTTPTNVTLRFKPTTNDNVNSTLSSLGIVTGPKNGSIGFISLDSLMYVPNKDFCGNDSIRYMICNTFNLCDTAFIYINVTCSPKKPVAVADNASTKKNVLVSVNVLANDTQNGTLTSTTIIKSPSRGTAVLNNNKIDYSPQKDSCGYIDTLQYRICNATGCDSAFVYITVSCDQPAQKPIARTDISSTKKNILVPIDVLANDTQNGVLNAITITKTPSRGTAVFNNYKLEYTPQKDSCSYSDTLQYKICNASGCDSAFVFVSVACDTPPPPKKPIAINDNVTTPKNVTLRFKPTLNDNINGTLSSLGIVSPPKNGSVGFIGLDSLMYTPKKDFCGNDTIRYMICNTSNLCDTAYIYITVTCEKAPVAVADKATTQKNKLVSIDFIANDTINGVLTSVKIIKAPSIGTAVINGNKIDYTPLKDVCNYNDTLQYKICNAVGCDSAKVIVAVSCDTSTTPKKPIAFLDNFSTPKNTPIYFKPTLNDQINGTLTSFDLNTLPKNGTIILLGFDSLVYTPNQDFCGKDSLKYIICNNFFLCDSAYIFINVTCDAKKPVAVADNSSTKKNVLVTVDVLANDTPNGTITSTTITKAPRRGTAVVKNGKIDYTPQKDSCSYSDTLQYKICNALGCDSAFVFVSIACDTPPPTKKPIAVNDNVTTPKNVTLRFKPTSNDNINGTLSSLSIVSPPKNGSIGFINLDSLMYVPNKDFCGNDTIRYMICNSYNLCDTAFIFINVSCDAKKPVTVNDNASTKKNQTVTIDILANDTPNGTLTATNILKDPKRGKVSFNGNKIDYTPTKDSCGYIDTFQYRICNAIGCDSAFVFVTVTCDTLVKPTARPDSVVTRKNTPIRVSILTNDQLNGTLDSIKITKNPLLGTASLGADNVITYTPAADSCGYTDTLRYKICNKAGCDETYVKITVQCDTIKKPVAVPDNSTTSVNTPVTINVVSNDSVFGLPIDSIVVTANPKHGKVAIFFGKLIYTPDSNYCDKSDTLRYAVFTKGGSDTTNVFVKINCKKDTLPPVAVVDGALGNKNATLIIDVTANDTLRGSDTFRITKAPLNGTAQFDSLKRIKYIPNKDFCGNDTLIYQIANSKGSDTAIVYININCGATKDSLPIANRDTAKTLFNQPVLISVTANDSLRGATTVVTIDSTMGIHGMAAVAADGKTVTYTPFRNFFGVDSFRYKICNKYGCDTTTVIVLIDAGDSIIVYNGFSPNGDGMNDEFIIQGIDKYADNEVFVWNRWGNEVFHEKGYSNSKAWDGRWNNLNVPDGTYYYCIFVNDPVNGSFRKTGYLQIQR